MIGATVTVNDPVAPTLDRVFPTGVAAGGIVGGDEPVTIDATDNAGIKRVEVLDVTAGPPQVVGAQDFPCDYSTSRRARTACARAQIPVAVPTAASARCACA